VEVVSIVSQFPAVAANLLVLPIGRTLGLTSVAAIVTELALVLGDLGPVARGGRPIPGALVAIQGALVFRQLLLVVANLLGLSSGLGLCLPFVLPIVADLGPIVPDLSGLVRALRVRTTEDQRRERKGSNVKCHCFHSEVLSFTCRQSWPGLKQGPFLDGRRTGGSRKCAGT